MPIKTINVGQIPNDRSGDDLRSGGQKINDNFSEIYEALGNGSSILEIVNNNFEIDLPNKANKISFLYDTFTSFPNSQNYVGSVAYANDTQRFYYATPNGWKELFSEITPPSISDLADVNEIGKQDGYVLKWNASENIWKTEIDVAQQIVDANGNVIQLDAGTLDGQDGLYYLDYNNFNNVPLYFDENTQILKYDDSNTIIDITTDNIPEGETNLYYSEGRLDSDLLQRSLSNFDNGWTLDSVYDVTAFPLNVNSSDLSCNSFFISSQDIEKIRAGDTIRIYGCANSSAEAQTQISKIFDVVSVEAVGFTEIEENNLPADENEYIALQYSFAELDVITGEISSQYSSAPKIYIETDPSKSFNAENNIKITFTDIGNTVEINKTLILVYRSLNGSDLLLTDVLSREDVQNSFYIDYRNFDHVPWSGKTANRNIYPASVVHVPRIAPQSQKLGWINRTVAGVNYQAGTIDVTNNVYLSSANDSVKIFHDDTNLIQSEITNRTLANKRSLKLNEKTYNVTGLEIPSNFKLHGIEGVTTIKKLPWSQNSIETINLIHLQDENTDSLIIDSAENVYIADLVLDGNSLNSYKVVDSLNYDKNFIVNLGTNSKNCALKNLTIINSIAGGIYCPESEGLLVTDCTISFSGLNDRYDFEPLYATEAESARIVNNKFSKYTKNVDVSVSENCVVTNNIIDSCGSGLFIFGSKFLISYPNILRDFSGELLPTPDILNTEYDSVNIFLQDDLPFTSDVYVYQENGNVFDLEANDLNQLKYNLYLLEKAENGNETLSEYSNTDVQLSDVSGFDKKQGQFKFSITKDSVNDIKQTLNTNEVVYRASLEEHVKVSDIQGSGSIIQETNGNFVYDVILDQLPYLFVGAEVEFINHFSNNETIKATVLNIDQNSKTVTVDNELITSGFSAGTGGFLNIINEFVLAQGRVL